MHGVSLSNIIRGANQKKCLRSTCSQHFHWEGSKCPHNFSFCERCQEIWYCKDLDNDHCPRHPKPKSEKKTDTDTTRTSGECDNEIDEQSLYDYIQTNLTAKEMFDEDDLYCDEICNYAFDKLKVYFCRHGMVKCDNCSNVWDGNAQCPCFMEPL